MQLPHDLLPILAKFAPRAAAALIRATSWAANGKNEQLWHSITFRTLDADPARLPEVQKAFVRENIRPEDRYSPGSADAALFTMPSMAEFIPAPIKVSAAQAFALRDGRFIMVRGNRLSLYTSMGQEIWADHGDGEHYDDFVVSEGQTWLALHTRNDAEVFRIGATMTESGVAFANGGDTPTFTFCGELYAVLSQADPTRTRFIVYTMATAADGARWEDPREAMAVVGAVGGVMAQYTDSDIVLYRLDGMPLRNFNDRGNLFIDVGMALGPLLYVWQSESDPKKLLEVDAATGEVKRELKGPKPQCSGMRLFRFKGHVCALIKFSDKHVAILADLEEKRRFQTFIAAHWLSSVSVSKEHIYYVDSRDQALVRYKLM